MLKKSHAGKAATANTSKHQMAQVNLLPFLILLIVFRGHKILKNFISVSLFYSP